MSACNCCEQFPTNVVVALQERSKSVGLTKCGFIGCTWDNYSGGITLLGTDIPTNEWVFEGGCIEPPTEQIIYLKRNVTFIQERGVGEPPATLTQEDTISFNPETGECDYTYTNSGEATDDIGTGEGSVNFSNEYTDSALIANALTQLPEEYTEWQNESLPFLFSANLIYGGAGNTNYELKISEVRIVHRPTATGYLKVWFKRIDYTWDGDDGWGNPTESEFQTYTWNGEPPSNQHGINEEENIIFSPAYELESSDQQLSRVYISKWSLIENYEPQDPDVDLGNSPVSLAIARPTPDCESNGVPTLSMACPFRT